MGLGLGVGYWLGLGSGIEKGARVESRISTPLDRVHRIHPPRLSPARQRHGLHPFVLREQVAQHRLRRVGGGSRIGWLLRLRPLPQRLQHVTVRVRAGIRVR